MFGYRVPEISATEVKELLDAGDDLVLLDIRTSHEREFSNIGGEHVEMTELPSRLDELEPHREQRLVVYCRSGARSANVVAFLLSHGFPRAVNLRGGIIAWSCDVDPTIPRY